jgi:hypothetical protein
MYNGQPERVKQPREDGVDNYLFDSPAIFIEPLNPLEIAQLGNGVQIYDPLTLRFHIYHVQLDNELGTLDENFDVFDFAKELFLALQNYQFDGAASFVRIAENLDFQHNNVYIYTVDFATNYIEQAATKPVGGQSVPGSYDVQSGKVQVIPNVDYE